MTVYTVTSTDGTARSKPPLTLVAGTYTTRGKALDECVAYLVWRLGDRQDLAWSMLNDEGHPEARKFLIKNKDGTVGVRKGCLDKLKEFVRDELGATGCYYIYDSDDRTWHFDVDENDLCGDAWTLVTWGDSDVEDPDFTTPFPELFTDKDRAVANAVKYAKDLMDSHGFDAKDQEQTVYWLRHALEADGEARLDLNDGAAVHWVLYRFGMETQNTEV